MSITLRYPAATGATYTVTLRGPMLDNEEITDLNVINRATRSGEPVSVRPANAIEAVTLRYRFEAITKTIKDSLDSFLRNTAGLEIGLVDHNGDVWYGVIPLEAVEYITIDDNCSYNLGLDFTGEKQ